MNGTDEDGTSVSTSAQHTIDMKEGYSIMKKLISLILTAILLTALAVPALAKDTAANSLLGGWTVNAENVAEIPQDVQDALTKATEELIGCTYEPVALLASQVVSGTNYCLLCRLTPVVPDAESSFALVYLYVDLENNASITRVADIEFSAQDEEESSEQTEDTATESLMGGWTVNAENVAEMPQDVQDALTKAAEELVGCTYEPVALLASQVVSGTNYCLLCRLTPVVPDAESSFALVYLYVDLENNASITRVADIEFDAAAETSEVQ